MILTTEKLYKRLSTRYTYCTFLMKMRTSSLENRIPFQAQEHPWFGE